MTRILAALDTFAPDRPADDSERQAAGIDPWPERKRTRGRMALLGALAAVVLIAPFWILLLPLFAGN